MMFGSMSWVFYFGIFMAVAVPVLIIGLRFALHGHSVAKIQGLRGSGVLALAQIMGFGETGTYINNRPLVNLSLHIAGPGFEFDSQKRVTVGIAQQGVITRRQLVVLVDPATRKYEIDWQASGLIAGVVPAQFMSVEDNRTYDLSGQVGPLMEILQIYQSNNLPFGGNFDLRQYPAVRQQVMAVVRRAAAAQAPQAPAGAPPASPPVVMPPQPSAAQRLQELETLRATGTISEAEYSAKRERIISEL